MAGRNYTKGGGIKQARQRFILPGVGKWNNYSSKQRVLQSIDNGFVSGKEREFSRLFRRDPTQLLPILGQGIAGKLHNMHEMQHHAQIGIIVAQRLSVQHCGADNAQLFAQFTHQSLANMLARLLFTAGKLPIPGPGLAVRTFGSQKTTVPPDDACRNLHCLHVFRQKIRSQAVPPGRVMCRASSGVSPARRTTARVYPSLL